MTCMRECQGRKYPTTAGNNYNNTRDTLKFGCLSKINYSSVVSMKKKSSSVVSKKQKSSPFVSKKKKSSSVVSKKKKSNLVA